MFPDLWPILPWDQCKTLEQFLLGNKPTNRYGWKYNLPWEVATIICCFLLLGRVYFRPQSVLMPCVSGHCVYNNNQAAWLPDPNNQTPLTSDIIPWWIYQNKSTQSISRATLHWPRNRINQNHLTNNSVIWCSLTVYDHPDRKLDVQQKRCQTVGIQQSLLCVSVYIGQRQLYHMKVETAGQKYFHPAAERHTSEHHLWHLLLWSGL